MTELKYIKQEEVPLIPHRTEPMRFAVYAPLAAAAFVPDVVIFRGNARQIMLMSEATRAAGIAEAGAVMGRPACAMIPQSVTAQASVTSVGCIGNRVYTGLRDDELSGVVPVVYVAGGQLPVIRVGVLREVGVFDERFFFSFDDLDFGLRLHGLIECFRRHRHAARQLRDGHNSGHLECS